jgi:2,3-bisphosphoglycerate-dependent phosphoglycerate mutase
MTSVTPKPDTGTLLLVRHAHSEYRPDDARGLSSAGRTAALRVADLLEPRAVARIVSSPFARAIETVQPLAERLGIAIEIDPDLRERALGAGHDDLRQRMEATWRDFDFAHPGGESNAAAQARVSSAIRRIAANTGDRNVAIASHGNALALFLHTLDPRVDFAFWSRMSMPDVYAVDLRGVPWSHRRIWHDALPEDRR